MTEAEWLTATDAVEMMITFRFASDVRRKLALFGVAGCRLIWDCLDESSRKRVVATEQDEDRTWNESDVATLFQGTLRREEGGVFCLSELQRHPGHPRTADLTRAVRRGGLRVSSPFAQRLAVCTTYPRVT
jgi:hypothetical protein